MKKVEVIKENAIYPVLLTAQFTEAGVYLQLGPIVNTLETFTGIQVGRNL